TEYQYHGNCSTTVSCSTSRRCSAVTSKPDSRRTAARSRTVTPSRSRTASACARFTRDPARSGWASRTRVWGFRDMVPFRPGGRVGVGVWRCGGSDLREPGYDVRAEDAHEPDGVRGRVAERQDVHLVDAGGGQLAHPL